MSSQQDNNEASNSSYIEQSWEEERIQLCKQGGLQAVERLDRELLGWDSQYGWPLADY